MASRLPVVATRLSGIPELVEDGTNGYLVPPADAQALAGAINSLFESEELRRRMGERGREKVAAEFSLRENVAKLSALFQATNEREGEEIRVMNEREGEEIRTAARAVPSREDDGLDADLRSQLARRAARFFSENKTNGDEKGGEAKVSFTRRGGGHDSEVYEVALAADGSLSRRAILKLHRPGRAADGEAVEQGRRFASQEHAALEFLWGEFTRRSARLSVPKPLDFLPEQAALVMEKCAGERLDVSLRWARLRRDERARARLLEQLNKCGEWLALFHQVTERTDAPAEVYGRIERDFHEELRACREVGLEASLASRIARRYERDKATVFDGRHRVVGRHCDFAPYNVIVADDRLAVIDFEGLQQGILYDDLCYFLGMVETMPFYHLGARLALRFRQSFLDGYAHGRGETNREHLEFFMLTTMVKIMAYSPVLRPRARGWRESLQRWQRLKFFKGWFRQRVS